MGSPETETTPVARDSPATQPGPPAPQSAAWADRIDRYVVLERLGEGGLGVVFAAYDPRLDRKVAIKVLHGATRSDPVASARFEREGKAMARVQHPNVVQVFDYGYADGVGFIAMEHVEGTTLRKWLSKETRSLSEIFTVFAGAGRGLHAAHQVGLLHRDFKPDNVIVDKNGTPRVLDFGLARTWNTADLPASSSEGSASSADEERLTQVGVVEGTVPYMAPERLSSQPDDARGDQYSFGVALFEAVYERRPFKGTKLEDMRKAIAEGLDDDDLSRKPVPGRIQRLLRRMLSQAADDRYASMLDVVRVLEYDASRSTRRVLTMALVLGAVFLGLYGIYGLTRPGELVVQAVGLDGPLVPTSVRVDGNRVELGGDGRARVTLPSGLKRVDIEADGYEPAKEIVDVDVGGTHELNVVLRRQTGTVNLTVQPRGGSVIVNGVDYGSRLVSTRLPTGQHEVLVRAEGYYDERTTWSVTPDSAQTHFVALSPAVTSTFPRSGVNRLGVFYPDLNDDGRMEVLHSSFNELLIIDPWNEEVLWQHDVGGLGLAQFLAVDMDGDGAIEPLVQYDRPSGSTVVELMSPLGRPEVRWRSAHPSQIPWSCRPLFLSKVATTPLVVAAVDDRVIGIDGTTGRTRWSRPLNDIVVALGGDDGDVVYALTMKDFSRVDPASGRVLWTHPLPPHCVEGDWNTVGKRVGMLSFPVVDLDGEGPLDTFIFAPGGEELGWTGLAFSADGELLWGRHQRYDFDTKYSFVGPSSGAGPVVMHRYGDNAGLVALDGTTGRELWNTDEGSLPIEFVHDGVRSVLGTVGSTVVNYAARTGDVLARSDDFEVEFVTLTQLSTNPPRVAAGSKEGDIYMLDENLQLLESLSIGGIPYKVRDRVDANEDGFVDLLVEGNGPVVVSGRKTLWTVKFSDAIRAPAVAADIDGNGSPELILATPLSLGVVDAATGQYRAEIETNSPMIATPSPVVGSDAVEVLAYPGDASLVRLELGSGAVLAKSDKHLAYGAPLVHDIDTDGALEIVLPPWNPRYGAEIFDYDTLTLEGTVETKSGVWPGPSVAEFPDGKVGIVLGHHDGTVSMFDGATRKVEWSRSTGLRVRRSPTVADVDGDGALEVLVAGGDEQLPQIFILDASTGKVEVEIPQLGAPPAGVAVVPRSDTERPDLLVGTNDGLASVAADGELRWQTDGAGASPYSPLVVADLERDGRPEALLGFRNGWLWVVDAMTGRILWRYNAGGEPIEAAPLPLDVDGDGISEVIVGGHDRRLTCLRTPAPAPPERSSGP